MNLPHVLGIAAAAALPPALLAMWLQWRLAEEKRAHASTHAVLFHLLVRIAQARRLPHDQDRPDNPEETP